MISDKQLLKKVCNLRTTIECLNFYTENITRQYFDIYIHEIHNE